MRLTVVSVVLASVFAAHRAVAEPPILPKAFGDRCVASVPTMRRSHMEFLLHQRDDTVRRGQRDSKFSLRGCVACHASQAEGGDYRRIDAPGEFCAACHTYIGATIDCFECHAATPALDPNAEALRNRLVGNAKP
jgi:hypothetical protein